MSRKIDKFNRISSKLLKISVYAGVTLGIASTGAAIAQATIPDAQVEANVLKALAGAPDLATEQITTKTVYGTVTLSGTVSSEAARTKAENLAANANGVQKVVDELSLGTAPSQQPVDPNGAPLQLQSDGTYAPAPGATAPNQAGGQNPVPGSAPAETAQRNNPDADQALDQQQVPQQAPAQQPQYPAQPNQPQYPNQPGATANNQQPYPPQPYGRRPVYPNYPGYTPYPPQGNPQQAPNGAYAQQPYQQQPVVGGQEAGQPVTIPTGAMLRVRMNRTISSRNTKPGTVFDGTVINDVLAGGFVAIPRGATVQGTVIDSKPSGAVSGRGELSIQLTQVTLGGKVYPLSSDLWAHNGADKTVESINKTLGVGALGAIIGAVAGGGRGAAIGGGVGAAAGLGSSAASGDRQVYIPAEAIVVFHTTADTPIVTVSEQEMQRLAYGAGPNASQPPVRREYRVYPGYPPPGYTPYPQPGYPPY